MLICLSKIKGPFGYSWKLKIEKNCSKIIFKYVNNIMGPIFNEKVAEKWNLWAHKQYTIRKKSQKATGEKKKLFSNAPLRGQYLTIIYYT